MPKRVLIIIVAVLIFFIAGIFISKKNIIKSVQSNINNAKEPLYVETLKSLVVSELAKEKMQEGECEISGITGQGHAYENNVEIEHNGRRLIVSQNICLDRVAPPQTTSSATRFEGASYILNQISCPNIDSYITCARFVQAKFDSKNDRLISMTENKGKPIYILLENNEVTIKTFENARLISSQKSRLEDLKFDRSKEYGILYGDIAYLSDFNYNKEKLPMGWILYSTFIKEFYVIK